MLTFATYTGRCALVRSGTIRFNYFGQVESNLADMLWLAAQHFGSENFRSIANKILRQRFDKKIRMKIDPHIRP